ncbi:MAG: extracellular solute-binding protein [Lachnospiraceae bacterium]|nr:extracellular solute-binding protein [Lachnospiraceae bacterium]
MRKIYIRVCILFGAVLLFAAALLTSGLLFSGCGTPKTEPEETEETVVTIWTKDYHDASFQRMRIEDYNRSNPDHIRVEYKIYSDNYFQSLQAAFQSHNAPDMMCYTPQVFDAFMPKNQFADLMPYMDEEFCKEFQSVLFDGINVIGGRCYFVPTGAVTARLYYNKEIFRRAGIRELPKTMEEVVSAARQITTRLSAEGIYGFAANLNTAKLALDRSILPQGTKELGIKAGYDFQRGCYDFTPYEPLLLQWRELMGEDCAYPNCHQMDIAPLRQLFSDGKIGMYISYNYSEKGSLTEQFPMEEEWGCTGLPTTSGRIRGSQEYTLGNAFLFNAKSENLDAAWKVYRALFANRTYLERYQEQELGCSLFADIRENAGASGSSHYFQVQNGESMWPRTPHERNANAVNVQGSDLYDTMKNLIFGEGDMTEELEDLSRRYQEAYQTGIRNNIGREIRIETFHPMHPWRQGEQKAGRENG